MFEDGLSDEQLIRPAPGRDDRNPDSEGVHGILRPTLERHGAAHDVVTRRMVEVLTGRDLLASPPSWNGKWLSAILGAADLPQHVLSLRHTEAAQRDTAKNLLADVGPPEALDAAVALDDDSLRRGSRWRPPGALAYADRYGAGTPLPNGMPDLHAQAFFADHVETISSARASADAIRGVRSAMAKSG
ncbi:transcriptional regulator [Sphingomonas sp. R86521]|uniref:transcriptional regulator n=1 Tax=Sphingomonas sp. R86521 TaxID=3093860 RepID=UPI0036D3D3B3